MSGEGGYESTVKIEHSHREFLCSSAFKTELGNNAQGAYRTLISSESISHQPQEKRKYPIPVWTVGFVKRNALLPSDGKFIQLNNTEQLIIVAA